MFNVPSIDNDTQAESHRILNLYTRYMLKKFKFSNYNHSIFKSCPRYQNYWAHLNGLLIKAKRNLYSKIYYLNYPPTSCKELDIIVKRFLYRKYNIVLYYNNKIRLKKNVGYQNFKFGFKYFLSDLFFDLRPRENNYCSNKEFYEVNKNHSNVLIISHDLFSINDTYKNLPKRLSLFLKKENINSKIIQPFDIGINIFEKIKHFRMILKKLYKCYLVSFLKLSDYHFIILELYSEIYKIKLKEYFSRKKYIFIINSYINDRYEPIYYEAAKQLNIKYFNYDYSLGYPVREISNLRYLPDTRKFSDIIFANSNFRKEQYKISTRFLKSPPKIYPSICPQSDYSSNKQVLNTFKLSNINIGIVDNNFDEDFAINKSDIDTLIELITNVDLKINFISQSKRGYLDKRFKKLNCYDFLTCKKGDFSKLKICNFIISIGWQGIALKAASIFKRPLFFYSKRGFPYDNNIFSLDKIKNIKIKRLCKRLWFNEKNLISELNIMINDKKYLKNFERDSLDFLNEIGFYENKIEDYFNLYFKV
tara:strand:+ start:806 stop:2407 length:1602 start_codon:yes stop_codon:yes gene_type:complete